MSDSGCLGPLAALGAPYSDAELDAELGLRLGSAHPSYPPSVCRALATAISERHRRIEIERAHVAEVDEWARDGVRSLNSVHAHYQAQIVRLQAALRRYGQHLPVCAYVGCVSVSDRCTCGLDELRGASEVQP